MRRIALVAVAVTAVAGVAAYMGSASGQPCLNLSGPKGALH